jgi:hypothetical protein
MPRAADYRHAAQVLRGRSAALTEAATSYRRHRVGEFGDGPVAEAHDSAVGSIASRFEGAGGELHTLAEMCERRADVCEEYARAVTRWFSLDAHERLANEFPGRPASWAEL